VTTPGAVPPSRARVALVTIALLLALAGAAALVWGLQAWRARGFTEWPMPRQTDIPTAIAVAPDGTVWFTLEFSDSIGLLRDGQLETVRKGSPNVEPLGLAIDRDGAAWFTDAPVQAVSRMTPDRRITAFPLGTATAKLGRLAVAPDGAVWFAEGTGFSVTRLRDGVLTRHPVGGITAPAFGVAADRSGTVWATLPGANRLARIAPDGAVTELDLPFRGGSPTDVTTAADGAVWFVLFRTGRIGRYAGGRFSEFALPSANPGLTALAVAPDGAVWFTALRAHGLGRLREGIVTEFPLPRQDARPFGVAVDTGGNVWYTDLAGWVGRLASTRAGGH
jgi:virginiamycin B lyase